MNGREHFIKCPFSGGLYPPLKHKSAGVLRAFDKKLILMRLVVNKTFCRVVFVSYTTGLCLLNLVACLRGADFFVLCHLSVYTDEFIIIFVNGKLLYLLNAFYRKSLKN